MVRRFTKLALVLAAVAALALPWFLAETAEGGGLGCQHNCRCSRLEFFDRLLPSSLPGQGGGALATVQRTVGLLLADPSTDWTEVRLTRLRGHLADLNEVMMSATADEREVPGGLEVSVSGDERTFAAIRKVVPDHVRRMEDFRGWSVEMEEMETALKLVIRADDPEEAEIIRALGFFGFLASGVHHPDNYMAIVRGKTVS